MTSIAPAPRIPASPREARPDAPLDRRVARALLRELFGAPAVRGFAVRYWDGTVEGGGAARFTLVLRRRGALRRVLLPPSELAFVEAYLRDDIDVEGDFVSASALGDRLASRLRSLPRLARILRLALRLPGDDAPRAVPATRRARWSRLLTRHTPERDAEAVRFHYDVSNDFYRLWLDERMQYSCAYFPDGDESLDEAQRAKLEHICRKLRLRPGERLLDIGCGWGGLLQYAAERFGVTGVGITLSEPQARLARERLAAAGLADRCRILLQDYRALPADGAFDKVVSVGMREHVGRARLGDYFRAAHGALRPGGLFLDHGIVRGGRFARIGPLQWAARRLWRRDAFITRYVFPGGELAPLAELVGAAERVGLEARDVENLREHYDRTLRHWTRRLERAHRAAAAIVGEREYRVWRLYMAATVLGFRCGRLTLCQTLYAKPHDDGTIELPATRADLHRA